LDQLISRPGAICFMSAIMPREGVARTKGRRTEQCPTHQSEDLWRHERRLFHVCLVAHLQNGRAEKVPDSGKFYWSWISRATRLMGARKVGIGGPARAFTRVQT